MLTYKSPRLVAHEDTLRTLLDDTQWCDTLVLLDFAALDAPSKRVEFADAVIHLLFGMMVGCCGRNMGADLHAAVLSTLAGCMDTELSLLVDLMLQSIPGGV